MTERLRPGEVHATGMLAARALARSGGALGMLAEFPAAPYRLAAGDVVWLGERGPMHPRAIFLRTGEASAGTRIVEPWAPACRDSAAPDIDRARRRLADTVPTLARLAPSSGLAPLLRDEVPGFPLAARVAEARAVARCAGADDTEGFLGAAHPLLGLGAGLTPSGDDYVGGALFALAHWRPDHLSWRHAAKSLEQVAHTRTHRISAALFADLARGRSFAALHALVDASLRDDAGLLASALAVTAIGHSSGWDMLTGFLAGSGAMNLSNSTS